MRTGIAASLVASALLATHPAGATGSRPQPGGQRPVARAAAVPARLQGSFAMHGVITRARHVLGERPGKRVHRSWTFTSTCAEGPCKRVSLIRERAGGLSERLVLHMLRAGVYRGRSRFFVPLRCGRRVYAHGGRAPFTITVRITAAEEDASEAFASAISARYAGRRRVNLTPCPGGIGVDSARYEGHLSEPLPPAPTASFTAAHDPNPESTAVSFQSTAAPASGGAPIKKWSWSFGDPATGAENASSSPTPTHVFSTHGQFTVTLTVTDANGLQASVVLPVQA